MKKSRRKYPGLIEYLESRLGPSVVSGRGWNEFYCPFCIDRMGDESSKRKFGVNTVEQRAHCFRCNYTATTLIRLFMDLSGGNLRMDEIAILRGEVKLPEASRLIRDEVLLMIYGDKKVKDEELTAPDLPKHLIWLTQRQHRKRCEAAITYLEGRGVGLEEIARSNIGYCLAGDHAGHLIFPVMQHGEMVCWTTRTIRKRAYLKSKNPKKVEGQHGRSTCLLGYDQCVGEKIVALCEGPFDRLAHEVAVALMGKELSGIHIRLLKELAALGMEELVISLDAFEVRTVDKMYAALKDQLPCRVSVLSLDSGDPDERRGELSELMESRGTPTIASRVRGRLQGRV